MIDTYNSDDLKLAYYVPEYAGKEDIYAPLKSLAKHCQDYKAQAQDLNYFISA